MGPVETDAFERYAKGIKKDLTGGTSQENDVAFGTGQMDIPCHIKRSEKSRYQTLLH